MTKGTDARTDTPSADESSTHDNEGFLERWSRRKTEATTADDETAAEPLDDAPAIAAAAHDQATTDDPTPPAPELPPLDTLDENSDYSAFLAPGVCADLKRQALRRLFQSPKFNIRDGLDDYDLDFTTFAPLGDVITAEMRHRMLQGLEKLADLADEPTTTAAATPPTADEPDAAERNDDDAAPV